MPEPTRLSPRVLVLVVLGLATVVKLAWARWSTGTCDVIFFYVFAEKLQTQSVAHLYQKVELFNHMPLTGWSVQGLYALCGGEYSSFARALRGVCIAADAALVLTLLLWRDALAGPAWWALALFAASPVSIMISGFHGNVDPVMTLFLFWAAAAACRGKPILCAFCFAFACNIKIVPILFAPVFFFYWTARGRRPAVQFAAITAIGLLLGTGWALWLAPVDFARQVLGYGSLWGTWGFTYWIRAFGPESVQKVDFKSLSAVQNWIMTALKLIVIAGMITIGWQRRRLEGRELFTTLALGFALVFTFAPGVGTQYMVWSAPFLLLYSAGWYAAITAAATFYMASFYAASANSLFPWDCVFPKGPDIPIWGPWTNLPWLAFTALLVWMWRQLRRVESLPRERLVEVQ